MGRLLLGVVLAMGVVSGVRAFQPANADKARKEILDLTNQSLAGLDISKKAQEVKKKLDDLEPFMHAYKPAKRGGIGFGPEKTNGIEMKIIQLMKRPLPPATLAKEANELIRMAHINIVMAEITRAHAPGKPRAGKGKKEWLRHVDDQKKAAEELIRAVRAQSPDRVKKAAANLITACNDCHTNFRD
jgi:hypothetical protein